MSNKLFYIFLFLPIFTFSQERLAVTGHVQNNSFPLENVHVKNVSSGKYSVSNASGEFSLGMMAGDTLLLSHVGMNDLINFIKKEDLKDEILIFRMTERSNELEEVVVNPDSEINAVSLGIIPKKIKKLTVNERRLKTAGDFKPKHLLGIIGGGLSIDAILNAINGRTKRLKRNVIIENDQRNIAFLEGNYMNYLEKEMKLSRQDAQLLIGYVLEEPQLEEVISANNEARMQLYLLDAWFRFQEERILKE